GRLGCSRRRIPGCNDPRRHVDPRDDGRAGGRACSEPPLVKAGTGRRTSGVLRNWARGFRYRRRLPRISGVLCQATDLDHRNTGDAVNCRDARAVGGWPAGTRAAAMSTATLYGLCSAALAGLGLFGLITHPQPLRKILAFNLIGSGVFLLFGVVG